MAARNQLDHLRDVEALVSEIGGQRVQAVSSIWDTGGTGNICIYSAPAEGDNWSRARRDCKHSGDGDNISA
jgi:hypothetical protein